MSAPAFGYLRVSTSGQADDGVSLDVQRDRIARWCELNGHELVRVFSDEGISGGKQKNRPGLRECIESVCEAKGVLVVYSLSRLSRSTEDTLGISRRLAGCGAELVSLIEQLDTESASGKMVFRMLAVFAEFERDLVSERTKAALRHKQSKGERTGRVPYGWDSDGSGAMKANDDEQEILSRIRDLRARGVAVNAIATDLNIRGTPAKHGGKWYASSVKSVLKGSRRVVELAGAA